MEDGLEGDGLGLDALAEGKEVRGFDGDVERLTDAFRERAERPGEFLIDDAVLRWMTINYGVGIDRDDATGLKQRGFGEAFAEHRAGGIGVEAEGFVVAVAADEARKLVDAQFGFEKNDLPFPAIAEEFAVEVFAIAILAGHAFVADRVDARIDRERVIGYELRRTGKATGEFQRGKNAVGFVAMHARHETKWDLLGVG